MDYFTYVACIVPLLLLTYAIKRMWANDYGLKPPPGPWALPLIGDLWHLAFRPIQLALTDLARQYGDVFAINILGHRNVVISSAKVAREAMQTQDFDGRPRPLPLIVSLITGNGNGIVNADYSPSLVAKRKVVHSALRMYGKNLRQLETKICEETAYLLNAFEANAGKPFDPKKDVSFVIANTIFTILFNRRYKAHDSEFRKMRQVAELVDSMCSPGNMFNLFPWLSIFPFPSLKRLLDGISYQHSIYKRLYMEHKATFDPDKVRDLVDALIKSFAEETRTAGRPKNAPMLSEDDMLYTIKDVFVGGFETQNVTVYWFLLYMITYPDIQAKAQAELDRVLGRDKLPGLNDRGHLPYTLALVAEVLRCSRVVPYIQKKAIRDRKLGGYNITKGTVLMLNLWAIHHDEREWSEPNIFEPSRFLDADGKFVGYANQSFMPFGGGRRVCLGESLAKIQLFLIIARLLHKFHLKAESTKPQMKTEDFCLNCPVPFNLCAISRS